MMRRLVVLTFPVFLGCTASTPLPPKKDAIAVPAPAIKPPAPAPLSLGQANAEILKVQTLPRAQRIAIWKTWASDQTQPQLHAHALTQLFWSADPECFSLALKAFASSYARVRATAARILGENTTSVEPAKSTLLDALSGAADEERLAILWTLVVRGEKSIAAKALNELRNGSLVKTTGIDGRNAYDALTLAALFSADEIKTLAKDTSPTVRQLIATHHAYAANGPAIEPLLVLSADAELDVRSLAIGGLAKSSDKRAREAVLEALRKTTPEQHIKYLERIRDIAGGPGLVLALEAVAAKPEEKVWFQTKQIFDMLESLADPRIAEPLLAWTLAYKRHGHWVGEAGSRIADVGDLRGAKLIGDRLRLDPMKLYKQEHFWEANGGGHLTRSDLPRVVGARMLADLAVIYPDKHAELLNAAEGGVLFWIKSSSQPHANALRFLAGAGSTKILNDLRKWAFPPDPLPKPGDSPPFPAVFETAQTSLRYIGMHKDELSFPKLLDQLQRKKDKSLDITQEGLVNGGYSMLGMSLRAIGYGAAQGLAHFGDARAVAPLMTFIEDETWHEEARQSACEALAWCADSKAMTDVALKVRAYGQSKEPAKVMIATCYAQTLAQRPVPEIVPLMIAGLGVQSSAEIRLAYGLAVGKAGLDTTTEGKLFSRLEDPASQQAAALAVVLGGSEDAVTRTIATLAEMGAPALKQFKDTYYRAFGYWSDHDLAQGNVYRWVAGAEVIRRVEVASKWQDWAPQRLEWQFANLRFDNGPHSQTRTVMRHRLWQDAKKGTPERRIGAMKTLELMQEQGVLLALRDEPGEVGNLARRALHRMANPLSVAPE